MKSFESYLDTQYILSPGVYGIERITILKTFVKISMVSSPRQKSVYLITTKEVNTGMFALK